MIGRGLALTGAGLTMGLLVALAATRAMRSLLIGVSATDPVTFGSVLGLLIGVSLVACTLPALRAARVDPLTVLRQE